MIAEFIDYLQYAGVTPRVLFAFTTDPVEDYTEELPVIMVYPQGYSAQPSEIDNMVVQAVDMEIVCLLGCKIEHYETLLAEMQAAVIGWTYEHYDAFELVGGSIEGINSGYIWWRETYTTRVQFRQST